MSTRGIIAERDDTHGGFRGRYHHWDSYPRGLGKALYTIYHEVFEKDLKSMLRVLLHEHTAGWSTIVDGDWACPIGFDEAGPQCYCHGTRSEPARGWVYPDTDSCCEFAYVIDKAKKTMAIFERQYESGEHAMGFFGIPIDDDAAWITVAIVDLDGPEPDWSKISAF